jgi:hypothetical protein
MAEAERSKKDITSMTLQDIERWKKEGCKAKLIDSLLDLIPSDDPEVERQRELKNRRKWAKLGEELEGPNFHNCYFFREDGTVGRTLYPLCKYSQILNIPQDIKPDWLDAAKRAVEIARTKFRCTEQDLASLNEAEAQLKKVTGCG